MGPAQNAGPTYREVTFRRVEKHSRIARHWPAPTIEIVKCICTFRLRICASEQQALQQACPAFCHLYDRRPVIAPSKSYSVNGHQKLVPTMPPRTPHNLNPAPAARPHPGLAWQATNWLTISVTLMMSVSPSSICVDTVSVNQPPAAAPNWRCSAAKSRRSMSPSMSSSNASRHVA